MSTGLLLVGGICQAQQVKVAVGQGVSKSLMPQLVEVYKALNREGDVAVIDIPEKGGLESLESEVLDVFVSMGGEKVKGTKVKKKVLAEDRLVVLVHIKNPLETIDVKQLAEVYQGKLSDWNALGLKVEGEQLKAKLLPLVSSSGTVSSWATSLVGKGNKLSISVKATPGSHAVSVVRNQIEAIALVNSTYSTSIGTKALKVGGKAYDAKDYFAKRDIVLYTSVKLDDDTMKFVNWLTSSPLAAKIVRKIGYQN